MPILPPPEPPKSEPQLWREFIDDRTAWTRKWLVLYLIAMTAYLGVLGEEKLSTSTAPKLSFYEWIPEVVYGTNVATLTWTRPQVQNGNFVSYQIMLFGSNGNDELRLPKVTQEASGDTETASITLDQLLPGERYSLRLVYELDDGSGNKSQRALSAPFPIRRKN